MRRLGGKGGDLVCDRGELVGEITDLVGENVFHVFELLKLCVGLDGVAFRWESLDCFEWKPEDDEFGCGVDAQLWPCGVSVFCGGKLGCEGDSWCDESGLSVVVAVGDLASGDPDAVAGADAGCDAGVDVDCGVGGCGCPSVEGAGEFECGLLGGESVGFTAVGGDGSLGGAEVECGVPYSCFDGEVGCGERDAVVGVCGKGDHGLVKCEHVCLLILLCAPLSGLLPTFSSPAGFEIWKSPTILSGGASSL